jgi:glucoamylase
MFMFMIRNFATSQWRFSKDLGGGARLQSVPGCIIASPSISGDVETNQDYVHFWVRDGALTVNECVYRDLPSTEMLNDYVSFSKLVQKNAMEVCKPAHACFKIDGSVRDWGQQGDGPALRILSILEIWDKLSDGAKSDARKVLENDQNYIKEHHNDRTHNAWEEVLGHSFFARAAQRHATEKLASMATKVGLDCNKMSDVIDALSGALNAHWDESQGHYLSILDGEPADKGNGLNSDLIFAATYAGMACFDERMLRTVAKLREHFSAAYPINVADAEQNMGPMLGRYPDDRYDGTPNEGQDNGHPWPLCTANLARFYYQCLLDLTASPSIVISGGMAQFFDQIGFNHTGPISKSSQRYKDLIGALLTAGDKLMRAVVYHSDYLELSEQNDRDSGMCTSVRSLTWSYSSFIAASRTREMAKSAI